MRAAGADQTKAVEAAKPVAQYDRDLADIQGGLRTIKWMFGFTLALTFQVFTSQ